MLLKALKFVYNMYNDLKFSDSKDKSDSTSKISVKDELYSKFETNTNDHL